MNRTMKPKKYIIFIVSFIIAASWVFIKPGKTEDVPETLPRADDVIPAFSLPAPLNKAYRSYLKLDREERFTPAEMNAQLLVIEVLNLY